MKRASLRGPKELEFENLTLDVEGMQDDQIYAETEFTAVSIGTELAAYLGQPPLRPGPAYPRLVGYCNVAQVAKLGCGVSGFSVGQRILTRQAHQSAYLARVDEILATIPENLPAETASMTYLAHIGLSALQKANFQPSENVAVLGLGVIGLATVGLARALGGRPIALGNDDFRMEKAREQGAHACFRSDDPDLKQKLNEVTDGVGVHLLVTTANPWQAWRTALEIPRYEGRIAVLGFPGRGEGPPSFNPLDTATVYVKQLSIFACGLVPSLGDLSEIRFNPQRNMCLLLGMVQEGTFALGKLLTHRVRWNELETIYQCALRHDKSLIGAVLDWRETQN